MGGMTIVEFFQTEQVARHCNAVRKRPDGLRLLIVIGACGTLTTAFRDRL
jgi:hypothetical protein